MKNKTEYAIKKTDDEILGALCTILWKRNNILGLKNLFLFQISLFFTFDQLLPILYLYKIDFKNISAKKNFIDNKDSIFFRLRENKSHPL